MKKRILVFVLIFCFLATSITAFAEKYIVLGDPDYQPVITVRRYNGTYYTENFTEAKMGDTLLVSVAFKSNVESLSTLGITLDYSADKVEYATSSFKSRVVSDDASAGDPLLHSGDGVLSAFWCQTDITKDIEFATNVTEIATFRFTCISNEGEVTFKATLDNAIDGNYQTIMLGGAVTEVTIPLSRDDGITDEEISAFNALTTITYPDSYDDIINADNIFNGFTSSKKKIFVKNYLDLYEAYCDAWTKYYDAAQNAKMEAIKAELGIYEETYAVALSIQNPTEVNQSNYVEVQQAYTAWNYLSSDAQSESFGYWLQLDSLQDAANITFLNANEDLDEEGNQLLDIRDLVRMKKMIAGLYGEELQTKYNATDLTNLRIYLLNN